MEFPNVNKGGRKGGLPRRDHGGIRLFVTSLAKARWDWINGGSTVLRETEGVELVFLCVFSYEMNLNEHPEIAAVADKNKGDSRVLLLAFLLASR